MRRGLSQGEGDACRCDRASRRIRAQVSLLPWCDDASDKGVAREVRGGRQGYLQRGFKGGERVGTWDSPNEARAHEVQPVVPAQATLYVGKRGCCDRCLL